MICAVLLGASGVAYALTRPQANQAVARRDARALLGQLRLPAGAKRSPSEPAGGGAALHPPRITNAHAVATDRWWISPESTASVLAYVEAHPPAAPGYLSRVTEGSTVIFTWTIDGAHLFSQQLQVTAQALGGGRIGIMAQAQSVWMVPRPLGERVADGVLAVDVTLRIGGGQDGRDAMHTHTYVLTGTKAAAVVRALDSLPITQPGLVYSCPAEFASEPSLTLAFKGGSGRSHPTVARASVDVYPGSKGASGWNACDAINFWIGGRRQTPLTSQTFVKRMAKLIGANFS